MEGNKGVVQVFWGALVVCVFSFCLPFIENDSGIRIYTEVFGRVVFEEKLSFKMIIILTLLSATAFWIPLMSYCFYRYTVQKRRYSFKQKAVNSYLFIIGFSVYGLILYAFLDGADVMKVFSYGYWLLMSCMTVMFVCYLKLQKKQLIDESDMSKHLIDHDNE